MSWVKKKFSKKKLKLKNQKAKSCKIHETKISVYMPVLPPSPRSAKQVSKSFSTNSHLNKKLCTLCKPIAGYRKLETELLFLKKVNIRDWNVLSVKGMIFRIVTAKILYAKQKKSRKLYLLKAIKFTHCPRLSLKGWAWRWFLRKLLASLKLL